MKIRTDFVTNSSSSSFIAVSVETKDGKNYYTSWDSGNITIEYLDDLTITKEQYQSFETGTELLDICNNFAKEVTASWRDKMPEYQMKEFDKDANKIREITDFSNTVAKVTIENNLEIVEPMFESTEIYDYLTGKYSHKVYDLANDEYFDEDEEFLDEEE